MSSSLPWFLSLSLAFLILDSHKMSMSDIRNKISIEPVLSGSLNTDASFSSNNGTNADELYSEKTNTLSIEMTNSSLPAVSAIRKENLGKKPKLRQYIAYLLSKSHHRRFRHRLNNSESNGQKKTSSQKIPKSGKTTWKVLSFARGLSEEMNENLMNRVGEEISKFIQYMPDGELTNGSEGYRSYSHKVQYIPLGSNPLTNMYAYFPNDPEIESQDSSPDDFVGCFAKHDFCHTSNHTLRKNLRRKSCSCDEDCEDYGNCCMDYKFRCGNVETAVHRLRYSCVKARSHFGYFAVSSCPSFWSNSYVHALCENTENDESDFLLQVPVSSKDTYLTYSNIYCAFCNGDMNAEFWSVEMQCPNSSLRSANVKGFIRCANGSTSFLEPSYLLQNSAEHVSARRSPNLFKCRYDVISKCSQHWMSQTWNQTVMEIAMKCILVYAPVSLLGILSSDVPRYKNEYCALCNGVTAIHLLCPIKMARSQPKPTSPMVSMSVLFEMDFTRGGMIVGSKERCPRMHLYDPWKEECRSVACKQHFEYKSGHCVPSVAYSDQLMDNHEENHQLFNDSSFSDCLQVILALEEVSISQNGTLVIRSDGSVYQPGEYENVNNSTVTVCIRWGTYRLYVPTFTSFQSHLTTAGMSISLIFLLIRIVLSVFFPESHKLPPKIVLFLSITLFFSQMLFLFGIYQTGNHAVCLVIGMLMHYGFLSSFFWTNVLAYDIWKTFGSSQMKTKARFARKQLLCYCMYGWVSPLIVVAVAAAFDWIATYEPLKPRYGKSMCWISNKAALAAFFGLPLALLLVLNTVFFFITSMEIRRTTKATKLVHDTCWRAKNRVRFGLYCKLAFIMGLTWVFGFIAAFSGSSVLWYFFIAFNSIQGVYIFVAFTHFEIPSNLIPKKSSQWTLSGNSTTSRSSTTVSGPMNKV